MKKIALYSILFLCVALVSCKQDDPNVQKTATQDMAGEWYVTYTSAVDGSDAGGGYLRLITSNTAANIATEMQVTDWTNPNDAGGNFWNYKVKVQVVPASKTFTVTDFVNALEDPFGNTDQMITFVNGKIIAKGGKSKTGVKVDSIYFEAQFQDVDDADSPESFIISGHKRTGFVEDDY